MKAITQSTYGSADVLRFDEVDRPTIGADEVLIRVSAAAVTTSDWHIMTGLPYLVRVMGFGFRAPKARIRGGDVAGQVEAVGSAVTAFQPGDAVYGVCTGALAEFARAGQGSIASKPANLSFEQAAAVPISGVTALTALRNVGKVQRGQRVLIIGAAGAVGGFAVQLAKAFGANVTGVCSTQAVELVRSIGADKVIDYTRGEALAGSSERFDLIIDTAGNRALAELRRALTPTGTLVIVGGEGGGRLLGGIQRQLLAVTMSAFSPQTMRSMFSVVRSEDLKFLAQLIEAGDVTPVIEKTYGFDETVQAFRRLEQGHARGKLVVTV